MTSSCSRAAARASGASSRCHGRRQTRSSCRRCRRAYCDASSRLTSGSCAQATRSTCHRALPITASPPASIASPTQSGFARRRGQTCSPRLRGTRHACVPRTSGTRTIASSWRWRSSTAARAAARAAAVPVLALAAAKLIFQGVASSPSRRRHGCGRWCVRACCPHWTTRPASRHGWGRPSLAPLPPPPPPPPRPLAPARPRRSCRLRWVPQAWRRRLKRRADLPSWGRRLGRLWRRG